MKVYIFYAVIEYRLNYEFDRDSDCLVFSNREDAEKEKIKRCWRGWKKTIFEREVK